ncbi:MAG TPA: nuclear transport factor 2 family protein [Solirubrobacterales bacterium]|nr:nuclear transport factor 2 family protein [Solirubrobacterales bacterium]
MSAQENKATAEAAYRAFSEGDAAGAMQNMDDGVEWTVRGDNSLTGSYRGKEEIGELWARFGEKGIKTEPHDFVADGDKVVVLTTVTLDGETTEAADVLTYNGDGKLIQFEQIGDPAVGNRVFARS